MIKLEKISMKIAPNRLNPWPKFIELAPRHIAMNAITQIRLIPWSKLKAG